MFTFNKEVTEMFQKMHSEKMERRQPRSVAACLIIPVFLLAGLRIVEVCVLSLRIMG